MNFRSRSNDGSSEYLTGRNTSQSVRSISNYHDGPAKADESVLGSQSFDSYRLQNFNNPSVNSINHNSGYNNLNNSSSSGFNNDNNGWYASNSESQDNSQTNFINSMPQDYRSPPILPIVQSKSQVEIWMEKPWIVWIFSIIQIAVFIAEFIKMGVLTGTPVQTQPSFNPMIGPSGYLLINMGARFTPCMHAIEGITDMPSLKFPCPNSTTTDTNTCSLQELCGMGGLGDPPNQWWRFITPIFLHAGIIHISFNLLLQIKLGSEIETTIGHIRFLIIYLAAGIGGFVFGGNFTPDGIVSTGASGSLFGIISLELLDLLFKWQLYEKPVRALLLLLVEIIISFGIGLLPGLDNFSHIGGFVIGILLGIALLRSPLFIQKQTGNSFKDQQEVLNGVETGGINDHLLKSATSFKNKSPLWYGWVAVRVAALALTIVYFVTLIKQFENGGGHCSWCKYLSCIPVKDWCNVGDIQVSDNGYSR